MNIRRWLCALVLLVCLFPAAHVRVPGAPAVMHAACAEEESQFPFLAETNELAVNVRQEMSTRSAKVGRLERGTQLTVHAAQMNASGEVWYDVELKDGIRGYIRSDLLIRSSVQMPLVLAAYVPVSGQSMEEETEMPASFQAKTTQNAVNVRLEASTTSGKAGRIARGEILTVLSSVVNSANETWYAVRLADGTEGYVRSDLLIEADEAEVLEASYQGTAKQTSAQKKPSGSGSYIGNRKTKKFHRPSCHTLPAAKNQVKFSSREKAISSGYVPCKNCDP